MPIPVLSWLDARQEADERSREQGLSGCECALNLHVPVHGSYLVIIAWRVMVLPGGEGSSISHENHALPYPLT